MDGLDTTTFWRTSYPVEAIRLTEENIQKVAYASGALYQRALDDDTSKPFIVAGSDVAEVGDWVAWYGENFFKLHSHEEFSTQFQTHLERLHKDMKYFKVFELVSKAMLAQDSAARHGDSNGDMDLLVMTTTQKILEEVSSWS